MYTDNAEPSLDEMMNDPVIRLRMSIARLGSDGVRRCLDRVRLRLQDRARQESAARQGTGGSRTS